MNTKTSRKRQAHRRGLWAEWLCAAFLLCKGYRVLVLRKRTPAGEIDLIAARGRTLVVVEVKARRETEEALYSVNRFKQRRLTAAANALLADKDVAGLARHPDFALRFDVMAVPPWRLPMHVKDAWRPE